MFHQTIFNPAFCGIDDNSRITGGYRNQWPGIDNGFVSYYIGYDQFSEKLEGGMGIDAERDMQGENVFSQTRINLMYSHQVMISKILSMNLGFQAGVTQKNINPTSLILPTDNPYYQMEGQSTQENLYTQTSIFPDFAAGVSFFYNEQYEADFSVDHLNLIKGLNTLNDYTYLVPLKLTVELFSRYPAKISAREKVLVFHPGIMIQVQQSYLFMNYGSNVSYGPVLVGLWLRNDLKLNINTCTFVAGYSWEALSLIYSYDLWLPKSDQAFQLFDAQEVTFTYIFKYNDPKKKMRALKCPIF